MGNIQPRFHSRRVHQVDSVDFLGGGRRGRIPRPRSRAGRSPTTHGVGSAFGSLEELAASPDVDGVYVCSPVDAHAAAVEVIAAAGKAILIEKPFATSAAEAEAIFATAERHKVFVMEAMWTRFLPAWQQIRALIDGGRIGEINARSGQSRLPDPRGNP